MPQSDLPWYKVRNATAPFSLRKKIRSNSPTAPPFRTIAPFPWTRDSLKILWGGSFLALRNSHQWQDMITKYSDAIAVGGVRDIYIFFTQKSFPPICITLPQAETDLKIIPTDVVNVAWTLDFVKSPPGSIIQPLLIFSHLNLLYIYNLEMRGVSSFLRGHGGAITSIAIHPTNLNLFCTTSRDYSTRVYDLNLPPQTESVNPPWPPITEGSQAGAAHGLHMTEPEGSGDGRCIVVLMGGRSGGHQAAVLGAAFHPQLPLIATCGLDRVVKIWFVPPASKIIITREDKPLFSSSKIHKARVLSVSWLHYDLLVTHSAPAIMKNSEDTEPKQMYNEPGQLTVWRWLGIDRFFPPTEEAGIRQSVLRGCASDYQESASFKIISTLPFPRDDPQSAAPILHIHQSPTHDPIILFMYPHSNLISIINVVHFQPRMPPPFPLDGVDLVQSTQTRMEQGVDRPEVLTWNVQTTDGCTSRDDESDQLMACAISNGGKTLIGVGIKGSIWIWEAAP